MANDRPLRPVAREFKMFSSTHFVTTPAAQALIPAREMVEAISRHLCGDWGDIDDNDWTANEKALKNGDRLMSVYTSMNGTKFYIITEADRSVTTTLLPNEY
jgi:hypothetical protein